MPTRKPARKGKGGRGQRGLHLLPGITALLEDDPKKIQQSETEGKNEVPDPVEHKVSITQDILIESGKNGEGLTCPGLSSTKPGWAQLHITAQVGSPFGEQNNSYLRWPGVVAW